MKEKDVGYYIFVVSDQEWQGNPTKAIDIFTSLISKNLWGFGERTPNRKNIKENDQIVFYQAGSEGQKFLGTAIYVKQTTSKDGDNSLIDNPYVVILKDPDVWKESKDLHPLIQNLDFIVNKEKWGVYFQGGVKSISKRDYEVIVSGGREVKKSEDSDVEDQTEFVLEKYLQEFIFTNWNKLNFKESLELYDDGQGNSAEQYPTSVGYIDILAKDKDNGEFVVIELKKGKESDKVIGQIQRYMGWIKKNLAKKGEEVRGIIIANSYDEKLIYALSVTKNIKLKYYNLKFSLEDGFKEGDELETKAKKGEIRLERKR
jgi:RecB family endonuclease NucS